MRKKKNLCKMCHRTWKGTVSGQGYFGSANVLTACCSNKPKGVMPYYER